MKALILAAGKGTRLRPLSLTMPKPLMPIANRPVLNYILDACEEAGIREIGLVVDHLNGPLANWSGWRGRGLKPMFIEQSLPLGMAHAVRVGERFVGREPFLVIAGDCCLDGSLAGLLQRHREGRVAATLALAAVEVPEEYGIAQLEGERVVRVVEKPQRPPGNQALMGVYAFDGRIFDAIDVIRPSPRNELELTNAIQGLIDQGLPVAGWAYQGFWQDAGRPEGVLAANDHWLGRLVPGVQGQVTRSHLQGPVAVAERARIINSTVHGPAIIGEGSAVINSWIGPFTSVGSHVLIEDSEVERSILMEACRVRGIVRLAESLVGVGNRIVRRTARPMTYRVIAGEGNEIEVP